MASLARSLLLAVLATWPGAAAVAQAQLFDAVAGALAARFFDRDFCSEHLPGLVDRFRPAALAATSPAAERAVVHAMLAEVPASHLALLSTATHERLEAEVLGQRTATLGCTLVQVDGRYYLDAVYEGGPAALGAVRRGELVVAIDGLPPGQSPRLDWRSDDAHLADAPSHDLLVAPGDAVALQLGTPDRPRTVRLVADYWSGLAASVASVRTLALGGREVLYVRLWYVYHGGASRVVGAALAEHGDCAGLVLDLRGRGGSALECGRVLDVLQAAQERGVAIVALIDRRTRSAKEMLADELRRRRLGTLVGEPTAGAVLPASFVDVAGDAVLMLPEQSLGAMSRRLEGRGVAPDWRVNDAWPPVAGRDPILWEGLQALEGILDERPAGRER